jgi:hypothetical protein
MALLVSPVTAGVVVAAAVADAGRGMYVTRQRVRAVIRRAAAGTEHPAAV